MVLLRDSGRYHTQAAAQAVKLEVLIGCETTGIVRDAFIARGHNAMSCDTKPTQRPGPHHQGDVFDLDWRYFDLVILHPPCTYVANSGSKHLYVGKRWENGIDHTRWRQMQEGAEFFKRCYDWNAPFVVCENPVMLDYAKVHAKIPKQTQIIQPWMFGHPETKATCLWLKGGLPKLVETNNVHAYMMTLPERERNRIHHMSPGKNRGAKRSETYPGIADAMADQWGRFVVEWKLAA